MSENLLRPEGAAEGAGVAAAPGRPGCDLRLVRHRARHLEFRRD